MKLGEDTQAEERACPEAQRQKRTWGFRVERRPVVWMVSDGERVVDEAVHRHHPDLQGPWRPEQGRELQLKYTRSCWAVVTSILAREQRPGFTELLRVSTLVFSLIRWDDTWGHLTGVS